MKYAFIQRIGQGAYGVVLKAREIQSGEIVAIKQIALKSYTQNQIDVLREISALKTFDHENIVTLKEILYSSTSISIVLEYVESNLKSVIYDEKRAVNMNLLKHIFFQVLKGIEYIHSLSIMHRDIKPENILVSQTLKIKIADFGLAGLYLPQDKERIYSHQVATRWYRAPELLFGSVHYTPSVDVWSFGCVLAEYINFAPLFEGANDIDQIGKVFKILGTPTRLNWPDWEETPDYGKMNFDKLEPIKDWHTIVASHNHALLAILQRCLQFNHHLRPSALELIQQDFFLTCSNNYSCIPPLASNETDEDLRLRKEFDLSLFDNLTLEDI